MCCMLVVLLLGASLYVMSINTLWIDFDNTFAVVKEFLMCFVCGIQRDRTFILIIALWLVL